MFIPALLWTEKSSLWGRDNIEEVYEVVTPHYLQIPPNYIYIAFYSLHRFWLFCDEIILESFLSLEFSVQTLVLQFLLT